MTLPSYERQGAFYLGRRVLDPAGTATDEPILYDAKDLTTHAMVVGMTGSGKTGLGIGLLEEAAMDGIPAIAIDPKGDLGNLLLSFPDLRPKDFEPWVEEAAATRKGMSVSEYATVTANQWREGLAAWGQDGERIRRLHAAADFTIYTPGSTAGRSLALLRSFDAPPRALLDDAEALRDRVGAVVGGLLGLVRIEADPLRSREHILLATLIERAWRDERSLDLGSLIAEIQDPGIQRLGVVDLESFYPAKDRFQLAMQLNNLLASPGFAAWTAGDPLDASRLLRTADGRPRIAIVSIAHLGDAERMFVVTLLLNEIVSWMRAQPGTSNLRALLYMDELFGYLPPTANPPSKVPLLTLLKQARAYGLGVVLATQNPVDLDYKALSNMGTWFLGRLQTERDKARVLDGLEGASMAASHAFDRAKVEATLSGLAGRVFLMNNVHDEAPVLFQTRWAMSYLRGPLTRTEIRALAAARGEPEPGDGASAVSGTDASARGGRPLVPPGVPERFVARIAGRRADTHLVYRPALLGRVRLHFVDARRGLDQWEERVLVARLRGEEVAADPWEDAAPLATVPEFDDRPTEGARFASLPSEAQREAPYKKWARSLKDHAYRANALTRWRCESLDAWSDAGESEAAFRARLRPLIEARRDTETKKLTEAHAIKRGRTEERLRKAEQRVEKERAQVAEIKRGFFMRIIETILAFLLGLFAGRKTLSSGTLGKAQTTLRGKSREAKEKLDVEQAEADVERVKAELAALDADLATGIDAVGARFDPAAFDLSPDEVRPRKSDIDVQSVILAWMPWFVSDDGENEAAFDAGGAA